MLRQKEPAAVAVLAGASCDSKMRQQTTFPRSTCNWLIGRQKYIRLLHVVLTRPSGIKTVEIGFFAILPLATSKGIAEHLGTLQLSNT